MNKKAFKENVMIVLTVIIVILAIIGIENNKKIETSYENNVEQTQTPSFSNPDRIIYKVGQEDKYYIFTKEETKVDYNDILTELVKGITGLSEGETITDEEANRYQENENCVILDYNKASKNYLIRLNSNDASVLIQRENGWQVVKRLIVNKLDIQKAIDKSIRNATAYTMKDNKNYLSVNTIEEIPEYYKDKITRKDNISYYMVIKDFETLTKFNTDFNVSIESEFNEEIFKNNNIVVLITKGKINEIKTCVGHIKYYINYEEYNGYMINEYLVSKVVNTNCIYTELKENEIIKMQDGYIIKNGIDYISAVSSNLLKSADIKELGLESKGNKTYSKIVAKDEMINIVNKLELKCISEMNYYDKISEKFKDDGKYIILLKNTKGRFSMKDFEYSEKYNGIQINKDISLNIFDIANNLGKTELKGIIIKLPNEVEINSVKLNRIQVNRNKIKSNKINITEAQAIEIARKSINDTDESSTYEVHYDLVADTNEFYQYKLDIEKEESLVQAYVVCKVNQGDDISEIKQVIINAQTGEIITNDYMPC